MSKYNEQHATTMLNALIGTDTLTEHDKQIRADVIDEMLNFINVRMSHLVDLAEEDCRKANTYQEHYHRGGLWELGIVRDEVVKLKEQNND